MRRPLPSLAQLASTVLLVGAALAMPSAASATTTVSQNGNTLLITGDDAPSALRHDGSYNGFQVEDTLGGPVIASTGCTAIAGKTNAVACSVYTGGETYGKFDAITANLGGGNDDYKYAIFDGPQTVDGGGGDDSIETSGGNDSVIGNSGNDTINGQKGDDSLDGGEGSDTVNGDDGNDTVAGGPGTDNLFGDGSTIYAIPGSDTILARDGEVDRVDCGGGSDQAQVDTGDIVSFCAAVDRPAGPTPTPGPNPTPTPVPTPAPTTELLLKGNVTKKQTPAALSKGKKITATLTANAACSGKVALAVSKTEAKRLKLGTKALTLGTSKSTSFTAGVATKVDVAVDKKYRSRLAKAAKLKTTVLIVCADATREYTGGAEITLKK